MSDNTTRLAGQGSDGPAPGTGRKVNTNRRIAAVAGGLFIIATVAGIISRVVFVQPILGAPDYLSAISANENRVLLGALFLLIGAAAASGIAIALYPVLRKHNEGLALGSVGFRLIEGALYVGIVVCLLMLVVLSQESAEAGTPAPSGLRVQAALLMAARDSLGQVSVLTFGLGALMYYSVFYRSRLVPRWLSAWGLVAIPLVMASMLLVMFRLIESFSPPQLVLALPIFLQEMVLAVWLIAKGFSPRAIASAPATAATPAIEPSSAGAGALS